MTTVGNTMNTTKSTRSQWYSKQKREEGKYQPIKMEGMIELEITILQPPVK